MNPSTSESREMSVSSAKSSPTQTSGKTAGKGSEHANEIDVAVFNLRDTLSGITVRETSFSEFLVALKQFGQQTATQ
jgi:hypothetical protein